MLILKTHDETLKWNNGLLIVCILTKINPYKHSLNTMIICRETGNNHFELRLPGIYQIRTSFVVKP